MYPPRTQLSIPNITNGKSYSTGNLQLFAPLPSPLREDTYTDAPSIYRSTALVKLGRFFQILSLYTVGSTPWKGDQPVARPLPTPRATKRQNKPTQTSLPRVGFEPPIPVFEWVKAVYALDRAAIVFGV
jgi:hypothetical protein